MIVFTDDRPDNWSSAVYTSLHGFVTAATHYGHRIYGLPADFSEVGGADAALDMLREQPEGTTGLLVGFIPSAERYTELAEAAAKLNIRMLNSAEDHLKAMEFDRFYPLISDLTAASVVISNATDIRQAEDEIGYPMFVKGLIKSRKEQGWKACVAENREELLKALSNSGNRPVTSRGKVVARQLMPLRRFGETKGDAFPVTWEWRCVAINGNVVACEPYWPEMQAAFESFGPSAELMSQIQTTAAVAARRLSVPLLIVDIGVLEDGTVRVIETGDPQVCGMPPGSAFAFFRALEI